MSKSRLGANIESAIFNQYMFSKIDFDNAKDVGDLIYATKKNHETLVLSIKEKVRRDAEIILSERLESYLSRGKLVMRVNGKLYSVEELTNDKNQ